MDPPVHGVAVAARRTEGWRAVWITGPSGAGKSDLALRLMARGFRLLADDYAFLRAERGRVYATAPAAIRDRMEVRGVGVVVAPAVRVAPVILHVVLSPGPVERLPAPTQSSICGVAVPRLTLNPYEASVVEKVAAAVRAL